MEKAKDMAYKRRAKKKPDLRKNPDKIDTSMGKKYLEEGRVVVLETNFMITGINKKQKL